MKLHDYFFGGVGATIDVNFVAGVLDGDLIVHVGAMNDSDDRAGATLMAIEGQRCPGWVRVPAVSVVSDGALAEWVGRGVVQARSLPRFDPSGWPERVSFMYAPNTGTVAFDLYEEEDPVVTAAMESKVRLAPDYCAPLPLWGRGLERIDVDDLGSSLLDDLRAWQAEFDREFHHKHGWSSDSARWRWADAAIGLEERLRAALPPWVELEVELWPLDR